MSKIKKYQKVSKSIKKVSKKYQKVYKDTFLIKKYNICL